MQRAKKLLSVLLSVLMLLSVSTAAFAADAQWTDVTTRDQLVAAIADGAQIRMTADITVSTRITVPAETSVTLDLNGHKLSRGLNENNSSAMPQGNAILVNGSLTIEDSSGNNSGSISDGFTRGYGGAIEVRGGSLTLNAGSICDNVVKSNTAAGGAIFVLGGDFTMNGGHIYDCAAGTGDYTSQGRGGAVYVANGDFTMNGGQISNCGIRTAQFNVNRNVNSGFGGAVYVSYNSTFLMRGGQIGGHNDESHNAGLNNQATKAGGAVYVGGSYEDYPAGRFLFKGGSINASYCSASNGGAVYVYEGAVFEMSGDAEMTHNTGSAVVIARGGAFDLSGGVISSNTPGDPGVIVVDGAFNMTGGTVTKNRGTYGGGIFVDVHGDATMSGGEITGNTGSHAGGGVYLKTPTDDDPEYIGGTFTMTGGRITGNYVSNYDGTSPSLGYGDGAGVWVGNDCTFNLSGGEITGNATCLLMYADDPDYNDYDAHVGLGGGVYVRPEGIFNVSGNPVIKGNKIGNKPETLIPYTENNVYLEDSARITVVGALDGAEIGV